MTNSPFTHSDGDIRASCGSQEPEQHSILPTASTFHLEIEAPGGKLKLNAQGRATITVVVAFLVMAVLIAIGGSIFLSRSQVNQPTVESFK